MVGSAGQPQWRGVIGKARLNGRTFAFRFGCGNRDADLLRAGGSQSVVHSGIRWRVRSGIALWIPTGRVVLWRD